MRSLHIIVSLISVILVLGCENWESENIRLNETQVIGTHNSYKLKPAPALVELLSQSQPGWADNILYEHRALFEQLDQVGVRQFELDIFADPEGGRFARPKGALLIGDNDFIDRPEMLEPGFKVLHTQDVDYRSNCLTFVSCLSEVKEWSLQNKNHIPVLIMVEIKTGSPSSHDGLEFTQPIPIDETNIYTVDEEILSVFTRDQVITPDDVRKSDETLEHAILNRGWPLLSESRGKILFALDNTGDVRDTYLSKSEILENRVMFVSSEPGTPSAAFIKMNDAINDLSLIKERVSKGYLIRTRSDTPMHEAQTGELTRMIAAFESGGHYISSDFPEPAPYPSQFVVKFPKNQSMKRCNPVTASASCNSDALKK